VRYATDCPVEPALPRFRGKGIGSKSYGGMAKKKAGFFTRIPVLKSPEFQDYY
jgi:hypothetical protein